MFEDSFLDSFMESHIGGWTADTERMYDEDDCYESNDSDPDGDGDYDPDYDVWNEDEYDDGFYDEDDERMENADLDFVQSDYI
jgi:hypothetical protein